MSMAAERFRERVWLALFLFCGLTCTAAAQSTFELTTPRASDHSVAVLDVQSLRITDGRGQETVYSRDDRFNSTDLQWIGYYSRQAQQVIRWPKSNSGNLQIGQLSTNGTVTYRQSQMTISPSRGSGNLVIPQPGSVTSRSQSLGSTPPISPEISQFFTSLWSDQPSRPALFQLAVRDERGLPSLLARQTRNRLTVLPAPGGSNADWYVIPAAKGLVRLTGNENGRISALAASPQKSLALEAATSDLRQLWRVLPAPIALGAYIFENAAFRGLVLGGGPGTPLGLQPLAFTSHQMWAPVAPTIPIPFEPLWRTNNVEMRPNPPLDPAQLELENSHRYALVILLGDRRTGNAFQQIRIEPQSRVTLELERDSGATLVETCEIRSISGVWERSQFVTAIPPAQLFDLSVYEEQLQSIAIDRTGTSPNLIEDVNYVPKSLGWLPLPAGDALPLVSRIDIFQAAKEARNPGAVRRFDPKAFDKKPKVDPVEAVLEDAKSKATSTKNDRRKL